VNRFSREANVAAVPPQPAGAARGAPAKEQLVEQSFANGTPEEARRLLEEVQQLGSRMRVNRRSAQQVDRRAAAYASRLARHTARLLQHMPNAVPAVRPVPGTGASTLQHYVLRHDQLESPARMRLLVVSSDGRLRICTVPTTEGPRIRLWNDYEVADPPPGLDLAVVFEGLSSMIVQLESGVKRAESTVAAKTTTLNDMIAESEARLAGANSKLKPLQEDSSEAAAHEVFGDVHPAGLKSYGFEHRLPLGAINPVGPSTIAPSAPAAAPPVATGRFAR
jgi:hypothetical protein